MKIEKMCNKQDLITNLKRAARYSNLEHLAKLADYINQNTDLKDLQDNLTMSSYEIKLAQGAYQIVQQDSKYNLASKKWEIVTEQVILKIDLSKIEQAKK